MSAACGSCENNVEPSLDASYILTQNSGFQNKRSYTIQSFYRCKGMKKNATNQTLFRFLNILYRNKRFILC